MDLPRWIITLPLLLLLWGCGDTPTGAGLPGPGGQGGGTLAFEGGEEWDLKVTGCVLDGDANAPRGLILLMEARHEPEDAYILVRRFIFPGADLSDPVFDPEDISDLFRISFGDRDEPESFIQAGYQPEDGPTTMAEPFLQIQSRSVTAEDIFLLPEGSVDPEDGVRLDLDASCP